MANMGNDHENMKTLMSLCEGDLIEFSRRRFSHWGVYLGNEDVVHFTCGGAPEQQTASLFASSGIIFSGPGTISIDNFWEIVGKGTAQKNNSGDYKHRPLDPQTIVENARKMLGQHEYDVLHFNCEHFVKWCRYGLLESDQVKNFVKGATAAVTTSFALLVGAALVWRLIKKNKKNKLYIKRNRRDKILWEI